MLGSKALMAVALGLALVPSAVQAGSVASSAAPSAAAQSLSVLHASRVGGKSGKTSHILGLGVLGSLLIAAGAVAAAVVVADAVDNSSSG